MTYQSTILPNTTHVWIAASTFVKECAGINAWLDDGSSDPGRVDVFAWEGDDYLDHWHFGAWGVGEGYFQPNFLSELLGWKALIEGVRRWSEIIEDNHDELAMMLFCFEDNDVALLFKLTFGGQA